MQTDELIEYVKTIQKLKCETQTVELKEASKGCPQRLYDTLSAFSNQDNGGVIIFGISEEHGYSVSGVYDAQDLQKKVTSQCNQMQPKVRALFTVCEIDGKSVVSAEIPGVDVSERPVFYEGKGRLRGSYIRVGDSDEPMTEYEIYSYDAFRKRLRDDIRTVQNMGAVLLDKEAIDEYIEKVKKDRKNLSSNVSDEEILELMGITSGGQPTLAGILIFSKYPQGYFPQLCVTAVRIPGTEMGYIGSDNERFIDNLRITGPIMQMLDDTVDFIRRNSRHKTIINEDGKRADKEEYPIKAVREAVLNALVHRDYSIHTEGTPIRVEMYDDRLEIISSGGLYGIISIDSLGYVRPETRNIALANILEMLHITENRYSGIPTIRRELKNAGLPEPVFAVRRGEFVVTFKNDTQKDSSVSNDNKVKDIIEFCKTPRSRAELIEFTGFSRYYTMQKIVKPLIDKGVIRLTIPDKPKSAKQKYYS